MGGGVPAPAGAASARTRRHVAGGLVLLLGLAVVLEARGMGVGTMARTGPGLFPLVLGVLLALVGALIAVVPDREEAQEAAVAARPDWRGWGCILGGVLAFILLGERLGLGPATFACVFVAAWGDRGATLRAALLLAAAATAVAAVVFSLLLKFQLPLLRW